MITDIWFENLTSTTITLNNNIYPLHLFETNIASRMEQRPRTGGDGSWPTFSYEGGMEITMEGDILASNSNDYWTKRYALISIFRYKPAVRERRSGVLYVQFDNAPEAFKTDVALDTISAPRNALSPAYSSFRIVLYSFTPYYVGVTTPANHYYDN